MVSPHFPSPTGGIELHVRGLSKNLVQRGHDVVMVAPSPVDVHFRFDGVEVFGAKSFRLPGWPYYSLRSFSVPYSFWSLVSQMSELIGRHEVDVVHAQGQKYLYTSMAVRLSHLMKVPTILTIHGTYGLRYYGSAGRFFEETFNRVVLAPTLRDASAVICCTQLEEGYAKQYYDDLKGFNIPNGIDVALFRDALKDKRSFRAEYEISLDRRVVLFVGRLTPVKGVIEFIEAIGMVAREFPEAFFVIVGDGPLREEVERLARHGNVRFFSWVPHSEMYKLYALSDIFVIPSKSEGQPLTLLEAMASHLYIVATRVGGIPETLGGYAYKTYINKCSPVEIVEGMRVAVENLSEAKAADSKSSSYVERFDWSNVTSETEKVYAYVLNR
jgi:glycosyltransferase involved in cell wall biosynthesis